MGLGGGSGNCDSSKLLEILNVRMIGAGDRVLVLSHGFGTDQSAWNRILPFFLRDYRVVLYDLVCAGSVNPDHFDFRRYTTLDAYVDDLLSLLDALSVDRCFFVGHSVSAMIGILAAIRRPRLFLKLIFVGASLGNGNPPSISSSYSEKTLNISLVTMFNRRFLNDHEEGYHGGFEREEIEEVLAAMEANYEAWVSGFAPLAVGADVPAAVREFSRTLFNMRPDISLFVSRTVFNSDLRGVLGLVRPPCVVVRTANDVSAPPSVANYLRAHLGGGTTVELLGDDGHLPHLSNPAAFVQVLHRALTTTTQ